MSGFTEEWFGVGSQRALVKLARRTVSLEGRVVEIGCWEGRSTCALANAVWPVPVDAVDTWGGSPGEISEMLAAERDVLATFRENIAEMTRGNVTVHQQSWREYAADRTPVRFLHIDAEHTYREVYDTIGQFLPLVVPGGIICGDDNHHPGVIGAARDLLGPVELDATLWWWSQDE